MSFDCHVKMQNQEGQSKVGSEKVWGRLVPMITFKRVNIQQSNIQRLRFEPLSFL